MISSVLFAVKSESEVTQSCLTLHDPVDCSLPRSSIDGIFQARVLGCRFLLQRIFLTQGLNPGLPHCRQMLYKCLIDGIYFHSPSNAMQQIIIASSLYRRQDYGPDHLNNMHSFSARSALPREPLRPRCARSELGLLLSQRRCRLPPVAIMIICRDLISHDETLSDIYTLREVAEGCVWRWRGRW